MKALVNDIVELRKIILFLVVVITLFLGYQIKNIKIDSDVTHYLPQKDPVVKLFNKIGDEFGANSIAMIAMETDDVFKPAVLTDIADVTEKLNGIKGVLSVNSLTDIIDIKKTKDGLEIGKLIESDALPHTTEEVKRLKKYVYSKDLYEGSIVSKDAKATIIMCRIQESANKVEVAKQIKETVKGMKLPEKVYYGGIPLQIIDIFKMIQGDIIRLLPIVVLIIAFVLFMSFGSLYGIVLPLLSVSISTIWVMGIMALIGRPLTIISDIIPVILIAVGSAYGIHLISKFNERVDYDTFLKKEYIKRVLSEVGIPIILSALTTVFGFVSFIFGSYLPAIKDFGLFTAVGVIFSLVITIFFVPGFLVSLKPKEKAVAERKLGITTFMDRLADFVLDRYKFIVLLFTLAFIASLFGLTKIERTSNITNYFKKSSAVRQTESLLEEKFGGAVPIQIFVKGDMQNPFILKEMWRMSKFLNSLNYVNNAQSVATLISEMNYNIDDKKTVPFEADKVTNLWFLLEGNDILTQLISDDYSEGIVQAMMGTIDTKYGRSIVDRVNAYIANPDKSWSVFDINDLTSEDKMKIRKITKRRVAEEILWDIMDYSENKPVKINKVQVMKILDAGENLEDNFVAVKSVLGAKLRVNNKLLEKIKGDISDLYDEQIALPDDMVKNMGILSTPLDNFEMTVKQSGMPLIYKKLDDSIFKSQYQSFLIAFILVFLLLLTQIKSVVGGLISMVPLVLTVFIIFGVMGYTHIALDIATALIAGVVIGIGIDYFIHFVNRFKAEFKKASSVKEALERTMETTGVAILVNALAVGLGFMTLMFAKLVPLQNFGLLVAIAMLVSAAGAVILLPALILMTHSRFVGDFSKMHNGFMNKMRQIKNKINNVGKK